MEDFALHVEPDAARPVVVLSGEVDLATSAEVRACAETLVAGGARHLTFDFSAVTFCDSTGLAVLAGLMQRDIAVSVRAPSERVALVLRVSGLDEALCAET